MTTLPKNLQKVADQYFELTDLDKKTFIQSAYQDYSFDVIAQACNTYKNRIVRDAKKLGIDIKSRSQAQKQAIQSGRTNHPTQGKTRSISTRKKISNSLVNTLKDTDMSDRVERGKKQWASKSYDEQQEFVKSGRKAIRKAAKEGSKLEKFLHHQLVQHMDEFGVVEYHKEHVIYGSKMHLDILLPQLRTVIEVDGISHKERVWGNDTYMASKKADNKKNGLLLGKGYVIIRVDYPKNVSMYNQTKTWENLYTQLKSIKDNFPNSDERSIRIGVDSE